MAEAPVRRWICQSARCGVTYEGTDRLCPQCGKPAAQANIMKLRGVAAIVAGLFLVGVMSLLMLYLGPQILDAGEPPGGGTFMGSSSDGIVVMALFAAIWLLGLVAVAGGALMLVKGRRSLAIISLMVPPLLVIVAIVALILGGFVLKE